ncbi:cytochrome c biogenesis CcdA family protein [Virgibacillus byunsanensis]|uniref:Cytochrome c biogenesis CcdA family protein n=1 Tax=Virgibacillus byunsanensis TaxID=570945 RepID=A0ABW3LEX1_9BACI
MSISVYYLLSIGIAAAFNPCGVAMLPSYISYLIGSKDGDYSYQKSITKGIQLGITMTAGFLLVFVLSGFALSWIGHSLNAVFPVFSIIVAALLILMGLGMLLGKHLPIKTISFQINSGKGSVFLYGIAYAFGSLSCTLPVFLLVVSQSMTNHSIVTTMMNFVFYSIGMGIVVTLITILSLVSRSLVQQFLRKYLSFIEKLTAVVILLSGIYLLVYWTSGPINF